jgi:DNA topoisomerase IB
MTIAAEPATAARQQASDAGAAQDLGRLVRSDPVAGGIRRRRCGRGFRYLGPAAPVTDPEILARIKALVIPPAWEDVACARPPAGTWKAAG